MTRADDYRDSIRQAIDRNDPREIVAIAEQFMRRTGNTGWSVVGVEYSVTGEWALDIRLGRETLHLSHRQQGNRWELNGLISDADLAEVLGVPVAYMEGFGDALSYLHEVMQSIKVSADNVKSEQERVRKAQKSIRATESKLSWTAALSREVRSAKTAAGRRAAKQIAQERHRCDVRVESLRQQGIPADGPYPAVPPAQCKAPWSGETTEVPKASGVYFVWDGSVVYVGQSVNLANRVRHTSHANINHGDYVSWLEFPVIDLDYAESYYIGICRPPRNFGKNAKWRQPSPEQSVPEGWIPSVVTGRRGVEMGAL